MLDGDRVVAGGRVTSIETVYGERRAHCDVWLERDGEHVVTGVAVVVLPADSGEAFGFAA